MPTFLLERVIPPAFDVRDPDQRALHSRWATDAYRAAGIVWLGAVATDEGNMYGLVVADSESDIDRYCESLSIAKADVTIRKVVGAVGPHVAMAKDDPRYRPPRKA